MIVSERIKFLQNIDDLIVVEGKKDNEGLRFFGLTNIVSISGQSIYPLDGGLMVDILAEKITKKQKSRKRIVLIITFITISILVFNFVGPLVI